MASSFEPHVGNFEKSQNPQFQELGQISRELVKFFSARISYESFLSDTSLFVLWLVRARASRNVVFHRLILEMNGEASGFDFSVAFNTFQDFFVLAPARRAPHLVLRSTYFQRHARGTPPQCPPRGRAARWVTSSGADTANPLEESLKGKDGVFVTLVSLEVAQDYSALRGAFENWHGFYLKLVPVEGDVEVLEDDMTSNAQRITNIESDYATE